MTLSLDIEGSAEIGLKKLRLARSKMPIVRKLTRILASHQPLLEIEAILNVKGSSAVGIVIENLLRLGVEHVDWLIEDDCADKDVLKALIHQYPERLRVHFVDPYQADYRDLELSYEDRYRFVVDEGGKFLAAIARYGGPSVDFGIIHTTRGLYEPKKHPDLKIPIVMVCNGILKKIFDNYYGCAIDLLVLLHKYGINFQGCPITVVGMGEVGQGILNLFKAAGGRVRFCEIDPMRILSTITLKQAENIIIHRAVKEDGAIIVLATGSNLYTTGKPALTAEVLKEVPAGNEVIVVIIGSGPELDLLGLCSISTEIISEATLRPLTVNDVLEFRLKGVTAFYLKNGGIVRLIGSGRRALNNEHGGHISSTMDPVLAYWLTLPYYHRKHPERMRSGPQDVPKEVERTLCSLVLEDMGVPSQALDAQLAKHYEISYFDELEAARIQGGGM